MNGFSPVSSTASLYDSRVRHVRAAGHRYALGHRTYYWLVDTDRLPRRRGRGHGEDPRYERLLAEAGPARARRARYALRMVYLLQGALVWLVSLPVQAACSAPQSIGALAVVAALVWLVGVTFEAVGDRQLRALKADPANRGRIMDRGLWAWTRHPNYFGDFLVWWGLYLLACTSLPVAAATLVSPVLMTFLLTAGSGKALLERQMADRPGYAAYRARTSGFVPRPPRRGPSSSTGFGEPD